MDDLTHVTGLAEIQKLFDTLPAKVERNILRGALRRGMRSVLTQAQAACPVGPPSSEGARLYKLYPGALRDSLRIGTSARNGRVIGAVKVGGKSAKTGAVVFYAHIIEYTGARRHAIQAKPGGALIFGGNAYASAEHTGMEPKPFLRPALDTQASAAVVSAAEYMKQRLATKEGLDVAHIRIEGDE